VEPANGNLNSGRRSVAFLDDACYNPRRLQLQRQYYKGESPLLREFSFIGVLLVVSAAFSIIALVAAWVIRPKRPNPIKAQTYECGMETVGTSWVQFRVQYYIYALVFVVFDVEAAFLFPVAVAFNQLKLYMVLEMVLFIIILAGALLYIWRKGVLEWV